jgi:hypothetical protein
MDLGTINFALSVVYMHDSLRCLKWSVDILLKLRLKGRKPLADAAASFNLLFLELSFARLKCYGFLADNQNLLRSGFAAFKFSLYIVLDLGLRLLMSVVVLKEDRGWNAGR